MIHEDLVRLMLCGNDVNGKIKIITETREIERRE